MILHNYVPILVTMKWSSTTFILLFASISTHGIYLPELDTTRNNAISNMSENLREINTNQPVAVVKLRRNTKTDLALTTIVVMGTAGLSVIYILCTVVMFLRHEDRNENIVNLSPIRQPTSHYRSSTTTNANYGEEIEPLMFQLSPFDA